MRIKNIHIHNFRSVKDTTFHLDDYSVLIGANNQGKSNIIRALRVFYECDKLKYRKPDDFPKFDTDDRDSWIELEFQLTDDENETLKDEYHLPDNTLKVRKYLQSSAGLVKGNQSNIYGYTPEGISDTLFYGAKNISQAKLGTVLYIPDVMTTEEAFKLKGPSPFRDVLNFVVGKVVKKSASYSALQSSFQKFDDQFPHDKSADGHSVKGIQESLNENIREWDVEFNLHINPIDTDEIIKSLVTHSLTDSDLGKDVDIKHFGQGLQRHLIYTILKMSTEYVDEDEPKKKEFNPDFTLILFEEPEAFLHPSQQEILNNSLHTLSEIEGNQVLATTHSPTFVSKNIELLSSLIRVKRKEGGISNIYQISDAEMDKLVLNNDGLYKHLEVTYNDPQTPPEDKTALGGNASF
ncbi:ATP-dependent endonuclease [Methanogenium cariaci]|uniref:ATP-dependent nuclease n=1 Tax=Methanogenium cariaci TaxID=2197 RepID=UPI000A746222|nr:AAA family ATPase [Methanogenium cariaci]